VEHAIERPMTTLGSPSSADFSPGEREYIQRGLDQFLSTLPSVAGGFQLRPWRRGPQKGQPTLPPPANSASPAAICFIVKVACGAGFAEVAFFGGAAALLAGLAAFLAGAAAFVAGGMAISIGRSRAAP